MMYSETLDPEFRMHLRINEKIKTSPVKPEIQPGGCYAIWAPHTVEFLLPVKDYYNSHPEYFALRNGKRRGVNTQPCFSNPDVLKICTEKLLDIMRKRPEFDIYQVSTTDHYQLCECSICKEEMMRLGNFTDLVLIS